MLLVVPILLSFHYELPLQASEHCRERNDPVNQRNVESDRDPAQRRTVQVSDNQVFGPWIKASRASRLLGTGPSNKLKDLFQLVRPEAGSPATLAWMAMSVTIQYTTHYRDVTVSGPAVTGRQMPYEIILCCRHHHDGAQERSAGLTRVQTGKRRPIDPLSPWYAGVEIRLSTGPAAQVLLPPRIKIAARLRSKASM